MTVISRRRLALAAAFLSAVAPSTAGADELTVTAQAVAAHGEFLTQAPPPPVQGVLCVVDAGVDLNPDTEPILVGRDSIYGGTVDDVSASSHGTYVAMVAGAAVNGWGMVGAWPRLKVLSVRALDGSGGQVAGAAFREGIQRCRHAKLDDGVDVRVIELAVGGPNAQRPEQEVLELREAVARARVDGMVVVSPAGNDGGPVNAPASVEHVLAVAAADAGGGLCGFSSRGPEVDITSLGCGMDVATSPDGSPGTGQSTSLASAYVAGVTVALRSYRPDLSVEQTEALLLSTAATGSAGRALDVGAVFRVAGLGELVDAYRPPALAGTPQAVASPRCDAKRRVCASPSLKSISRRGRRVVIRLTRVPRGTRVYVWADGRRVRRTRSKIIRLNVRRWKTLTIRFTASGRRPSVPLRIARAEVQ